MRQRDRAIALLVAACAVAGCSRLTFVKPNPDRDSYDQVTPDYDVREDPHESQRVLAQERVGAAAEALRGGDLAQAAKLARQALDSDRTMADAHTVLALVAERQGQAAKAGDEYAAAAKLAPTRGIALNNYGVWL